MIDINFTALATTAKTIKEELQDDVNDLIVDNSLELNKRILRRTPVRSGTLLDGWEYDVDYNSDGWAVSHITNEVDYAEYVENGTVNMDGKHMVAISLQEIDTKLDNDIRRIK